MHKRVIALLSLVCLLSGLLPTAGSTSAGHPGLSLYLHLTVDDGYGAPFRVGVDADAEYGAYILQAPVGKSATMVPAMRTNIANGAVEATVTLGYKGSTGLAARVRWDGPSMSWSQYSCMVDINGRVSCGVLMNQSWRTLVATQAAAGVLTEHPTLTLAMSEDHLQFGINGRLVADAHDDRPASGKRGVVSETPKSATERASASFDDVTVAIAPEHYAVDGVELELQELVSAAE
jgi:hypothetical protein